MNAESGAEPRRTDASSGSKAPEAVLERLRALRELDAPTHGGHLLSYVYDPGRPELDELAAEAIRIMQPVNGLDPTTFRSVAELEHDLVEFSRQVFRGGDDVVGTATSGGTESCLLAVKTARDAWRFRGGTGRPRLVAPTTVHAAFRKAAALLDLDLDLVPVNNMTGELDIEAVKARLDSNVALAVVSAPNYPHAVLDPVPEVAEAALAAGVDLHVDACIGGFALAFWPESAAHGADREWDFRVPGVTSLSADFHKYGYAPKGVSVLLQRGRDRQRHQWFATTSWPGYPVVNATLLGSRSAGPLAAAWAIVQALGESGFRELTESMANSTKALSDAVADIRGLRVFGSPTGPMLALINDPLAASSDKVDPHLWADAMAAHGFVVQQQPANRQPDGSLLPATAHLTITPVTGAVLDELIQAARRAADDVRGQPHLDGTAVAGVLFGDTATKLSELDGIDSQQALEILRAAGLLGGRLGPLAPVLALVETLPAALVERLLIELLAAGIERRV